MSDPSTSRVVKLEAWQRDHDDTEPVVRLIEQHLLSMVFQPIVDLGRKRVYAYEALCRGELPDFTDPQILVQAATSVGRVGELGRLQRQLAVGRCRDWPIFLNLSPNEFDQEWLVRPDDPIFRHRRPVYLEITESVPLTYFEQCHSVLAELREKGARLAIDDLGAGYSNLKYIVDLSPDIVKIDRDLVRGCTVGSRQFEMLSSLVRLCQRMEARVVAEGVERPEELIAVNLAGVDYCQGFLLAPPEPQPSGLCHPVIDLLDDGDEVPEELDAEEREAGEARLEELAALRGRLEACVRHTTAEVVRLQGSLQEAEATRRRLGTELTEAQSSLEESERLRRRLAYLFQASVLRRAGGRGRDGQVLEMPSDDSLEETAAPRSEGSAAPAARGTTQPARRTARRRSSRWGRVAALLVAAAMLPLGHAAEESSDTAAAPALAPALAEESGSRAAAASAAGSGGARAGRSGDGC